ncbi:hypothetical protein F0U44_07390 [Nocardioides humilatus]|uniref:Calcium-binding protein n=1 Tax=Nocardioides humilatus TaxID=2607660 RepID=A0A5B1LHN6_9ACTN|nr:hypothetical protein [Nocardioides humilatus]KAA1420235.1 hypothetical protein F0U44_07390 [Nocardioides humilatus]
MSAPRTRRAAATLLAVTGLVITPAFVQAASGQPDPGAPGKGRPDRIAPPAPAPACDLGDGQGTGCTSVELTSESTLDLGGTTTIDVAVTSVTDLSDATLTIRANSALTLSGTTGFTAAGTQPSGVGPMAAVSRTIDVTADHTAHFTIQVTGAKSGHGVLQARLDALGGQFDGGDELTVELGQVAPLSPRDLPVKSAPAGTKIAEPSYTGRVRTPRIKGPQSLDPGTPGASCATGTWTYVDETATLQPSWNFGIEVWDDDPTGTDDLLATGLTNPDGTFNLCFESTDEEGGGQEVFIRLPVSNSAWKIRQNPAGQAWTFIVPAPIAIPDPGTANYSTLTPSGTYNRLVHAFDSLNKLYQWQGDVNGNAMDNPAESRQMVANWNVGSVDGTYYDPATNDIHLKEADPDSDHTTIHEAAKALMDALYDDAYPATPSCSPRLIFGTTSPGCAWVEGWADWVAARVLDDPYVRFPDGSSSDLELPSWVDYPTAYGDSVEGRVAGALIDLSDSANDAPWDRWGEGGATAGSEEIYATLAAKQTSATFNEYFAMDRTGEGDTGYLARSALFQNTIDYTHRDPLTSTQELSRPGLDVQPSPHRYSFATTPSNFYWAGVAIRPLVSGDYDLTLYGDEAQATSIAASYYGGSTVDYVVVDGNHRTGSFFPLANLYTGTGTYTIEEYTGTQVFGLGASTYSFGANDVLRLWDVQAASGVTQYIGVAPDSGLDLNLAAHVSDGTLATTAQGSHQAVAASYNPGVGSREFVQYSLAASDWTGVIVLNQSGTAGNYTLYRDTASPTSPAVQIDGGNAQSYDTTVDLALSASPTNGAGNTPVVQMQISTDGVFDTEPWVDYATTGTASAPAGLGTKTVSVRYRNAAGATSATATDTIDVVATPTCEGLTATVAAFGTVTGTTGADVIVGGPGADAIAGLGGNDTICGLGGNDSINDGPGADTVYGSTGNDVFTQPAATDNGDVFDGGSGTDQVSYGARSGNVTVTLDGNNDDGVSGEGDTVQTTVENVTAGGGSDTIAGTSAANRLIGNGGEDTITGGGGNDYLTGNGADDTLTGGDGTDTILGGDGEDTVLEGAVANGADLVKGGTGYDLIDYGARTADLAIRLNGVPTSGAAGENDKLLNVEKAIGGSGNDTIVGHVTADTLNGGDGNDSINGQGSGDTLTGGAGNDTVFGGNGPDDLNTVDGVSGNDTASGGAGTDTASTDPGDIRISIP